MNTDALVARSIVLKARIVAASTGTPSDASPRRCMELVRVELGCSLARARELVMSVVPGLRSVSP